MAELKCGADGCVYNKSEYCCKGDIMVGGKHACDCDQTCCESFSQKKDDSYSSAMEHASRTISIDCEATKCVYNANYTCRAPKVDILGNHAMNADGTCCGTFKEK